MEIKEISLESIIEIGGEKLSISEAFERGIEEGSIKKGIRKKFDKKYYKALAKISPLKGWKKGDKNQIYSNKLKGLLEQYLRDETSKNFDVPLIGVFLGFSIFLISVLIFKFPVEFGDLTNYEKYPLLESVIFIIIITIVVVMVTIKYYYYREDQREGERKLKRNVRRLNRNHEHSK